MSERSYSESEVRGLITRLRSTKTHWIVYREYIRVFGISHGCFLCYLINKLDYWVKKDKVDDGWFYCKVDTIKAALGLSRDQQLRTIAQLKKRGVVDTRVKGYPPKRYFKLDLIKIEQMTGSLTPNPVKTEVNLNSLASTTTDSLASTTTDSRVSTTPSIRQVEQSSRTQSFVVNSAAHAASPTDVPTIPKNPEHKVSTMREGFGIIPQYSEAVPSTFDTTIVGRLITLLQNKKVSIQNKRARSVWPKEIAKLRREVSEERISSVFSWYERNAGLKYTPEVLCAKTFRIKFAKLESAMKRSSGGSEPVAILPEDEKIANDIGAWNWPAGLKKELPPFVATVRKQYQTIKAKLTAHITGLEQYSDGRPKDHFAQTVYSLLRSMPSSGGFVKLWVKEVHQKILFAIGKHGEWKGSLIRTHGTLLGSERFETWIASLTKSETKWQKIKSEVLS